MPDRTLRCDAAASHSPPVLLREAGVVAGPVERVRASVRMLAGCLPP
ncbi:hypothetical protein ABZW30_29835 [Kitasatospora sp. NPDC004669]